MKRIVKAPEIRRQEIIEAAQRLFEKEGYSKTSIEAIIQEAGIAKGTFYYYFKSKQEILRAIVESITWEVKDYFESIVQDKGLSSVEKLREMIVGSKKKEKIRPDVMAIVDLPENRELQEQLNIEAVNLIAPLMTKVFIQGFQEGVFKKKASLEGLQLILAGIQFVISSGLFDWTPDKKLAFLEEAQILLETHVGAKEGTLSFIKTA